MLWGRGYYINKQVLPQAPSPTITNLRLISAILLSTWVESLESEIRASRPIAVKEVAGRNVEQQKVYRNKKGHDIPGI